MINLDLEKFISQQIEKSVIEYIKSDELKQKIQQQVELSVTAILDKVAGKIYSEVISKNDYAANIKKIVDLQVAAAIQQESLLAVRTQIANTPVSEIIDRATRQETNIRIQNLDFPNNSINPAAINWQWGSINGSYIKGGKILNFSSTGIDDKSNKTEISIIDNHVVVNNQLSATVINATDQINAANVSVLGTLEIGNDIIDHGALKQFVSDSCSDIIDEKLTTVNELIEKTELISKDSIAPSVVNSNIRKLGNLNELTVLGDAKFSETVYISSGGKVGVNTEEPRGALTVWDEDAELSVLKTNKRTMFVGSTRLNDIELGVNNKASIRLQEDLVDIQTKVRIMGIKFSVSNSVPDYIGDPNEIVFVSTARENQPMFYLCMGGNRWRAL